MQNCDSKNARTYLVSARRLQGKSVKTASPRQKRNYRNRSYLHLRGMCLLVSPYHTVRSSSHASPTIARSAPQKLAAQLG